MMSKPVVMQYAWRTAGTISAAQSALTTDKTAATVHALASTKLTRITPDDGTIALDLRFKSEGTANDSNVVNLYAMRGNSDSYTLICTFTLTVGTQTDGTYLFVDTIVSTNEMWADDIVVVSEASNGIAHVELNTHGYKNFALIATTLNSTSVLTDWARV